jgi:hypothetical protein
MIHQDKMPIFLKKILKKFVGVAAHDTAGEYYWVSTLEVDYGQ